MSHRIEDFRDRSLVKRHEQDSEGTVESAKQDMLRHKPLSVG